MKWLKPQVVQPERVQEREADLVEPRKPQWLRVSRRTRAGGEELDLPQEGDCLGEHYEKLDWGALESRNPYSDSRAPRFSCLGLSRSSLIPKHFVGAIWTGKTWEHVLAVLPKIPKLDLAAMFMRCLSHEATADLVVSGEHTKSMGKWPALHIWTDSDQPKLPVPGELNRHLTPIVALTYLRALYDFCIRHLRRDYRRVVENLVGRCKGKILVTRNIRENTVRGRPDRIVCAYQEHLLNTPLNQILRAALEMAARCVWQLHPSADALAHARHWVCACFAQLAGVDDVRITSRDFSGLKFAGTLAPYKPVIGLARAVLSQHVILADGTVGSPETPPESLPFAIDMSRLFELYAFSFIRDGGWKGCQQVEVSGLRPDAVLWNEAEREVQGRSRMIVDFKYKDYDSPASDELAQLVGYAANKALQRGELRGVPSRCLLVYCSNRKEVPDAVRVRGPDEVTGAIRSAFGQGSNSNKEYAWNRSELGQNAPECEIGRIGIELPTLAGPGEASAGSPVAESS